MIRTLIIDDEPLALQQLATYVSKVPFLTLVAKCQSAIEALDIINREQIDALFVDINMPDLNGMDFVRSLAAPPLVVFTTAYTDYAVDGYKVDAVDYLLKPFSLDDFRRAALRVKKRYEQENTLFAPTENAPQTDSADAEQPLTTDTDNKPFAIDDAIFLKTEHRAVRINIADIRYIEGMAEYLKVYIVGQPRPIIMLLSMKRMEERLPNNFVRIHRSYIVNMNHVQELTKNRIVMDVDTLLPIGDMYKDTLTQYLADKYLGR